VTCATGGSNCVGAAECEIVHSCCSGFLKYRHWPSHSGGGSTEQEKQMSQDTIRELTVEELADVSGGAKNNPSLDALFAITDKAIRQLNEIHAPTYLPPGH
jgi:hypothetical protein